MSNEQLTINQTSLKTGLEIIKRMSNFTLKQLLDGKDVKKQAFVLYSLPGIGKSEGLTSLAQSDEYIETIDINAEFGGSLDMPIQHVFKDESGNPHALVLHALHEKIDKLNKHALTHPKTPHYLFLDEFNRGDEFMRQTLMQLLLNTRLPGHELAQNIFVIGAGNTSENIFTDELLENDVNPLDVAARDRIAPLFISLNTKDWLKWAYQNKIHPSIIMFIEQATDPASKLYQAPKTEDSTGATPRSWTKLSDLLDEFNPKRESPSILKPLIQSQIGTELSDEFLSYLSTEPNFDIDNILKNPKESLKTFDELTAPDRRQALLLMPMFLEKQLERGSDVYFKSFEQILKTEDQTTLSTFINIYLENDILRQNFESLFTKLNESEQFNEIRSLYSANM